MARHAGLRISVFPDIITLASGMQATLNHEEVVETTNSSQRNIQNIIEEYVDYSVTNGKIQSEKEIEVFISYNQSYEKIAMGLLYVTDLKCGEAEARNGKLHRKC